MVCRDAGFWSNLAPDLRLTRWMVSPTPTTTTPATAAVSARRGQLLVLFGMLALMLGFLGLVPSSAGFVGRAKGFIASQFGLPFYAVADEAKNIPVTHIAAVTPRGWRRTKNGWEHTSSWRPQRSLSDFVHVEQQREQFWIHHFFNGVRNVPPLAYACLQIAAISAICWISQVSKTVVTREHDSEEAAKSTVECG